MENGSQNGSKSIPGIHIFRDLFRRSTFGCILIAPWPPFRSLWLHFRPLWLPFGLLWAPFCALLAPFWTLLATFWTPLAPFYFLLEPFSSFGSHFGSIFHFCTPILYFSSKRHKFSFKIEFSTPRLAIHLQNTQRNLHRGSPSFFAQHPYPPGPERHLAVGNLDNSNMFWDSSFLHGVGGIPLRPQISFSLKHATAVGSYLCNIFQKNNPSVDFPI